MQLFGVFGTKQGFFGMHHWLVLCSLFRILLTKRAPENRKKIGWLSPEKQKLNSTHQ